MVAQMVHGIARALSEGQSDTGAEYEARSILVTGGAGFIASHVVIRLVQRYPEAKVSCELHHSGRCPSKESLERWLSNPVNNWVREQHHWTRTRCRGLGICFECCI